MFIKGVLNVSNLLSILKQMMCIKFYLIHGESITTNFVNLKVVCP